MRILCDVTKVRCYQGLVHYCWGSVLPVSCALLLELDATRILCIIARVRWYQGLVRCF
jgi:hypothetical protein